LATSPDPSSFRDVVREHLRLFTDQLAGETGDLRAANARLRSLIDIGWELSSEPDADCMLQTVCVASRSLFGATYVTLGVLDPTGRIVDRFFACGDAGICGSGVAKWLEAGDAVPALFHAVVAGRETVRARNPDGDPIALDLPRLHPEVHALLAAPIASANRVYGWVCLVGNEARTFSETDEHLLLVLAGQVAAIYELEHEIVERKEAEALSRRERDRAQRYLDTADIILLALDLDERITLINRKGCDVLGWTEQELLGRDWPDACLPARLREVHRGRFLGVIRDDLSIMESLIVLKSGEERLIEWRTTLHRDDTGQVIGTLSSGADVTERRALEGQSQQAQKMEAIGLLAGGVAHDFNNMLTSILGYCELLLADLNPTDPRQADIVEIQKAGNSAAGLTRQLLAFSRKEIIEPALLDLNAIVTEMQSMLGRIIREDVEVVLGLDPKLGTVAADRGQIEQIVMNLAVNARDAMPTGGRLLIETANVELDEHYARAHLSVKPGAYVVLSVSDTGNGITPEVRARLFEPFFTTKPRGKGTGLGLATVHGIVTRSGGTINVYSEVDHGTAFKVYLPRTEALEVVAAPPALPGPRGGTQTVLVVEDADGLRELTRRLLERHGYTVLTAANTDEALASFESGRSIDVLLTDVVMPGGSGPDLVKQLTERQPGLKVIYMSGYTEESIVHHGVLKPGIAFLHKPFTSDGLGRKIREVIDR
jgi:two-component system, cell cycle sensor histidine kinase and response regulator CckA